MSKRDNNREGTGYELIENVVHINRTAKVIKGGREFRFSALVVVGDGKGKVGFGLGKGREVPVAIQKAMAEARTSMIAIPLYRGTLQHAINGRHGATKVFMRPASEGTGVIAGGAMRPVFEALGVTDVLAKCVGRSSNPLNVVRATLAGLKAMMTPESVARRRGIPIDAMLNQIGRESEIETVAT